MAKTSAFAYSNVSDGTHSVTQKDLQLVSNYALTKDTSRAASLNNKTAPTDATELVTFQSRDLARVDTEVDILYPARVTKGIEYKIGIENVLVTTDTSDPDFRVDDPITASLMIRHTKSGNVTGAIVGAVVTRLISACMKQDGTWRFDDLMRSAERPVVN